MWGACTVRWSAGVTLSGALCSNLDHRLGGHKDLHRACVLCSLEGFVGQGGAGLPACALGQLAHDRGAWP